MARKKKLETRKKWPWLAGLHISYTPIVHSLVHNLFIKSIPIFNRLSFVNQCLVIHILTLHAFIIIFKSSLQKHCRMLTFEVRDTLQWLLCGLHVMKTWMCRTGLVSYTWLPWKLFLFNTCNCPLNKRNYRLEKKRLLFSQTDKYHMFVL